MKKYISVTAVSLTLVIMSYLVGCRADIDLSGGTDSADNSSVSAVSDNSASEGSDNSAPESSGIIEDKGEPTFLTCPDGTPIYRSEITEFRNVAMNADRSHEQYPLDSFSRETFGDHSTEVMCDGFTYAFIPRLNVCAAEAPDKFTEHFGTQRYSGDPLPPSNEYFRVEVGDKFGPLTVSKAQILFSTMACYGSSADPEKVAGVYASGAELGFEGEIEMTGYLRILEDEGYQSSGDLFFYPDTESAAKIPAVMYTLDTEKPELGVCHSAADGVFDGYGEFTEMMLGNMYEDYSSLDFYGMKPGSEYHHVKVTIKDPSVSWFYGMGCGGTLAAVEPV